MVLFVGLPAIAIFLTAALWIVGYADRQAHRIQEAEMAKEAATFAARFDEYLGKASRVADMTARSIAYFPNLLDNQVYGLLRGNVKLNRRIYGAAMAFEPGKEPRDVAKESRLHSPYVFENRERDGLSEMNITEAEYDWYNDPQWEWWHRPKTEKKGIWTDPYFDEGAGNILMFTYAVPFKMGGEFAGVTTVDIDLERLHDDIRESLPDIGDFVIIKDTGEYIFVDDPDKIMSETIWESLENRGRSDLIPEVKEMLSGTKGELTIDGLFANERIMVSYAPIPSTGWTFMTFRSEADALADFHARRTGIIAFFLIAAMVMLGTVLFMSGQVAKPIRSLRGKVLRIAEGEPDVTVSDIKTRDEIGELAGAFNAMQEKVTDRETKLAHARETTLTELLESAPDAMLIIDSEGIVRRVNTKVEKLFGYKRDELLGGSIEALLPLSSKGKHAGHLKRYFSAPETRAGMELAGKCKNGKEFPVEIGLSPFHEDGHIMAVAAIRDITDRKEAEAQLLEARELAEAANHAKSDFLSSMSHELRTPLNGVLGYAQILQRDKEATLRQRENVESIINCGDHLLSLINDVLDLSKIEAGRMDIDPAPCDLEKLIRSLTDIVGERARSKDLAFAVDVSPEVPKGIITDGAKLRQVMVNLLGNAVKFTDEGSVTLKVSESTKGELALEVIDTGIGLEAHELEEIFDPFKQVEAGKAKGGTGLGLAISRQIAEKLGGTLEVDSEKGKGSCFRVKIPLEEYDHGDLDASEIGELKDLSSAVLADGQDLHILVADDRETNRNILEQILEDAGFKITLADDGDTTLEAIDKEDFDLVLLDVRMPRLNGIETVKRIRANEKSRDLKVIAVTASVFPEFREKAIGAGFDDFLPKPFRASELMLRLEEQLGIEWVTEAPGAEGIAEKAVPVDFSLTEEDLKDLKASLKIKNLTALTALGKRLQEDDTYRAAGVEIERMARSFDFAGLAELEAKISE